MRITEGQIADWEKRYPLVDVRAEVVSMLPTFERWRNRPEWREDTLASWGRKFYEPLTPASAIGLIVTGLSSGQRFAEIREKRKKATR